MSAAMLPSEAPWVALAVAVDAVVNVAVEGLGEQALRGELAAKPDAPSRKDGSAQPISACVDPARLTISRIVIGPDSLPLDVGRGSLPIRPDASGTEPRPGFNRCPCAHTPGC